MQLEDINTDGAVLKIYRDNSTVCRKPSERIIDMATFTSCFDSQFERSSISFFQSLLDGVDLNSVFTTVFKRMDGISYRFR